MEKHKCKIQQILIDDQDQFNENFKRFILDNEQNLEQLSKLFNEISKIKVQSYSTYITEPQCFQNLIQSGIAELEHNNQFDFNDGNLQKLEKTDKDQLGENVKKNNDELTPHENSPIEVQLMTHKLLDIEQNQFDRENENKLDTLQEEQQIKPSPIEQISLLDVDIQDQAENIQDVIDQQTLNKRQEIESVFSRSIYQDIKFQVENARVGQQYQSKINVVSQHDVDEIKFKAESFKFPSDVFYFDTETQTILGHPDVAEDFEFSFQFYGKNAENETRTAKCRLNIIPDPRSLWKVIEPEAGQAFAKIHTDKNLINEPLYKIIAASRRGRSHEHGGTFRDDDFSIVQIPNSQWSILTVADGAGSAQYSREGSRIAVDIVQNEFQRYLNEHTIDALNDDLKQWQVGSQDNITTDIAKKLNQQFFHVYYEIYKSIIAQIEQQANELGVNPKVFSTTLLVAVVCSQKEKTFISTFSVGDGAIAVYSDDSVRIMNVPDGGEYAGQTQFLDRSINQELGSRIKIGCFNNIDAVMLMSDGISDPIFETDVGLANHEKWKKLYAELNPLMKVDSADTALLEWMYFFTPGHHDDRTMAVLWKK